MQEYIRSFNALNPTENIAYRKGEVTKADHEKNSLDVKCGEDEYTSLPVFYFCSGGEYDNVYGSINGGSYAFDKGDEVLVRFYNNRAERVCGFYKDLWPCVPMPAEALITTEKVFSEHIFQKTEAITAEKNLFEQRYTRIPQKDCSVTHRQYINQPAPADMSGFVVMQTDTVAATYSSRDVTVYFNGTPVYSTYNYDTASGVFNGTRSNIFAEMIHPVTNTGVLIYQVNTFTDWKPRVSGRVDFDFYLFCSDGEHAKIASGYSDVAGYYSPAEGTGIITAEGFYTDTEETGYAFFADVRLGSMLYFSADKSSQKPVYSNKTKSIHLLLYQKNNRVIIRTEEKTYNETGAMLLPDGSYGVAEKGFYKKIR